MKSKPVISREQAYRDVDEAISHYLSEDAEQAALGFVAKLERAYHHISRRPATGSPRYIHELNLPALWVWALNRYPHLVSYVERSDHVDVSRILHGQHDISAWMREPEQF